MCRRQKMPHTVSRPPAAPAGRGPVACPELDRRQVETQGRITRGAPHLLQPEVHPARGRTTRRPWRCAGTCSANTSTCWPKAQLKTLRDAWAYHQQQQGIDVTSSYRSERAAYTPGLSMPQIKAGARGETLYHEQQDEQDDNRTQAWITRQLEQAHQTLLRHAELQQLLRKSKDARARDYLRDNARLMDELVARSRDQVETFRPGRMPDWSRAYRQQAPGRRGRVFTLTHPATPSILSSLVLYSLMVRSSRWFNEKNSLWLIAKPCLREGRTIPSAKLPPPGR